jgi:hypothetical protein
MISDLPCGILPLLYFEYRNWGPARRVGSPKDNIEQGISNCETLKLELDIKLWRRYYVCVTSQRRNYGPHNYYAAT